MPKREKGMLIACGKGNQGGGKRETKRLDMLEKKKKSCTKV
jgi:hypothetical protein